MLIVLLQDFRYDEDLIYFDGSDKRNIIKILELKMKRYVYVFNKLSMY